jgi:hypothetical protein
LETRKAANKPRGKKKSKQQEKRDSEWSESFGNRQLEIGCQPVSRLAVFLK